VNDSVEVGDCLPDPGGGLVIDDSGARRQGEHDGIEPQDEEVGDRDRHVDHGHLSRTAAGMRT
jgi:hypothetical protein